MCDRDLTARVIDRAVANGARALVLIGDTPMPAGQTRYSAAPDSRRAHLSNVDHSIVDVAQLAPDATVQDPSAVLDDVVWLLDPWGPPVAVKGVLRADDARAVADAEASAVAVSNHGNRQLGRALSTVEAPTCIADADADAFDTGLYVDGGIRDCATALIALAFVARAVLVSRPVIWGLAADGAACAHRALRSLIDDLAEFLAIAGWTDAPTVARDLVVDLAPR